MTFQKKASIVLCFFVAFFRPISGFDVSPAPNFPKRTNEDLVTCLQEPRNAKNTTMVRELQTELVTQNSNWLTTCVRKTMRQSFTNPDTHDELYSAAVIGMLHSVPRFNASFGTKFMTFSTYWIRSEMLTCVYENRMVRIPAYLRRMNFKLTPFIAHNDLDLASPECLDALEAHSNAIGLNYTRVSLSNYIHSKQISIQGEAFSACDGDHLPKRSDVWEALARMPEEERRYILLRYFDESGEVVSYRVIAGRVGSSREWVRRKTVFALQKLRNIMTMNE